MKITPEHISLATGRQLSQLFDASENTITAWAVGTQEASGRLISRAAAKGIPKEVLVKGLDLRRERAEEIAKKRRELDKHLASVLPATQAA
jgi:hypothetical protein